MKKLFAVILALTLTLGTAGSLCAGAEDEAPAKPTGFGADGGLFAHAVSGSADGEAWQRWQCEHDEDFENVNENDMYFFLPSSAKGNAVEIYNGYSQSVTLAGVTIGAKETKAVTCKTGETYSVTVEGATRSLTCLRSGAEAAVYINNPNADDKGTELAAYLAQSKSNSASATGAIVTPDGKIDNTAIKKIKGRGNTSWDKPKKGFNVTYSSKVSVAGMTANKKYSLLANYQDDSLSRNRFLYDLSDAVGMPYASDSRYIDFYINGYYYGSYQMCEKVEPGSLVTDVDDKGYLNKDGTLKDDFSFIAEVDASAAEDDYYFYAANGSKITIKSPEIDPGKPFYDEVKSYVKEKYDAFAAALKSRKSDLAAVADVESLTKLWLINELGKNWDSGVSSTFFTYKPDKNGDYKFFGSPVWDYDNTLGNANGIAGDLNYIGVKDYTEYTGWWCKFKGKGQSERASKNNMINFISQHNSVAAVAPGIWFRDFVPAIEHFSGKAFDEYIDTELKTADEYYELLTDSAEMNYKSGWLLKTGKWIADHTSLNKAEFDLSTLTYTVSDKATAYDQNDFTDMYRYAADWMTSRAAWISEQYKASYTPPEAGLLGDVDGNNKVDITDATLVQMKAARLILFKASQRAVADFNHDGKIDITDATLIQMKAAGIG